MTDNADPRINLLFISRHDGKLVGSAPLFGAGQSGTDLTAIGLIAYLRLLVERIPAESIRRRMTTVMWGYGAASVPSYARSAY
ncbi:MAG: hypothetical protein ACE5EF_13640, partial [Dehalococcoidia bacterium]